MIARTYFPAALRNSIGEDAIHLLTSRPYIAQGYLHGSQLQGPVTVFYRYRSLCEAKDES